MLKVTTWLSSVVEHQPSDPKKEGLNPAAGTGREKMGKD